MGNKATILSNFDRLLQQGMKRRQISDLRTLRERINRITPLSRRGLDRVRVTGVATTRVAKAIEAVLHAPGIFHEQSDQCVRLSMPVLASNEVRDMRPQLATNDTDVIFDAPDDNMSEFGIRKGDHLIIQQQQHIDEAIAVVLIDGEYTVKLVTDCGANWRLRDKNYDEAIIKRDAQLIGIVAKLFRTL
jgi:Peptidase S24-like